MKKLLLGLVFLISTISFSQSLNAYKYVFVPEKFETLSKPNQFRLNELTKALLEKEGFIVITEQLALKDNISLNDCLVLKANLIDNSGLLTTKLALEFLDCKGLVVYTTPFGKSKEKSLLVAFNIALRNAGKHISALNYKFDNTILVNRDASVSKVDTYKLKAKIEALEKQNEVLIKNNKSLSKKDTISSGLKPKSSSKIEKNAGEYYAQARQKEGWKDYNIFNDKGILYFVFFSTGKKDVYLVQQSNNSDKQICFKNEGLWYLISRNETKMETKVLKINF